MDSEIPLNPKTSLADEEEKDRNEEKGQQVECKGIFPDKLYRLENFANRIHNQSQDANIVTTVNQAKISNSPVSEDNALSQCNENSESGSNKMIKIEEMCEPQLIEERAEDERSLDCMASISTGEHIIGTGTVRNGKSVSVVNAKQLTACESSWVLPDNTMKEVTSANGVGHLS
ncbi:hypothetical protein LSTR_LSTR003616 [Laodelphax striatellus]|uniref:Uncharacterized protein n=1 Tax=Laodelphax striatellus TaxID=195883 RepID=A0A482WLU6_LAOST|nr:hypothetical protein LSTR_LSTR003616 [Laodelphax striatellus]